MAKTVNSAGYQVVAVNAAVGENSGEITIHTSNDGNIGWSSVVEGVIPDNFIGGEFKVPIKNTTQALEEVGAGRVDFIKIDVEGFESSVLKGLRGYFNSGNPLPLIMCEVADDRTQKKSGTNLEELFQYMESFGYTSYIIDGKSLKEINYSDLLKPRNSIASVVWKAIK